MARLGISECLGEVGRDGLTESPAVAAGGEKGAVEIDVLAVVIVGVSYDLEVLLLPGTKADLPPSPTVSIVVDAKPLGHQNDLAYIALQYKTEIDERKELEEASRPSIDGAASFNPRVRGQTGVVEALAGMAQILDVLDVVQVLSDQADHLEGQVWHTLIIPTQYSIPGRQLMSAGPLTRVESMEESGVLTSSSFFLFGGP